VAAPEVLPASAVAVLEVERGCLRAQTGQLVAEAIFAAVAAPVPSPRLGVPEVDTVVAPSHVAPQVSGRKPEDQGAVEDTVATVSGAVGAVR
jgi:hypothetical protein